MLHIGIFNLFPRPSSSRTSRAGNLGKFLKALNVLGTKSNNFQPSTNRLEKTRCIFFVTIVWKTGKFLLLFSGSFWIDLMFGNFLKESLHTFWIRWWWRGLVGKKIMYASYVGEGVIPKVYICVQRRKGVQKSALGFIHTSWKTLQDNIKGPHIMYVGGGGSEGFCGGHEIF